MLTFRQIQNCEGYYCNVQTGEILRNVGPGDTRCWSEGSWNETGATADTDDAQFELLSTDVQASLESIRQQVANKYGRSAPDRLLNRQTAVQPDGTVVTEESDADTGVSGGPDTQ